MGTLIIRMSRATDGTWERHREGEWDSSFDSATFINDSPTHACRLRFGNDETFGPDQNFAVVRPGAARRIPFNNKSVQTQCWLEDAAVHRILSGTPWIPPGD